MALRHYIVDVWIDEDCVTESELDTAISAVIGDLQECIDGTSSDISYELVDMGYVGEE